MFNNGDDGGRFGRRAVRALPQEFPADMQIHDPAMGRGYRIGNAQVVPANTAESNAVCLINHGQANKIGRWKVSINVQDPEGNDVALSGAGLAFILRVRMENDDIPRTTFVGIGGGMVIYAPGRSINLVAYNPYDIDLTAHWNIDEVTAGISVWEDRDIFVGSTALTAETTLTLPPFCTYLEAFTTSLGSAPTLKGYANGGTVVYQEVLSIPRSSKIQIVQGLEYTITPGHSGQELAVLYTCQG